MAVTIMLRVGDSSGSDIALTSSGVAVIDEYPMGTPDVSQAVNANLGDGNELSVPEWANVTESLELHIKAATAADVSTKIRAIERLLELTRHGTTGMYGGKLYLRIQFDYDSVAWRSQIIAARLEVEKGTGQIWREFTQATLIITRRYYWETEAAIPLEVTSGTTTTPTTSYATIYNNDDAHATQRNWVNIAAAQIGGSIPAPAKLYIKNTSGGTRNFGALYIGNYVFNDPAGIDPIFRGELADSVDTTPAAIEGESYVWGLGSIGLVERFLGQFGRFVVVWSDRPAATTLIRAAVQYRTPTAFDLALGEQMLDSTSDFVMDLGGLPIPPSGYTAGIAALLNLVIKAKTPSGGDTLGVDWLQIFPSGSGLYRVLKGIFSMTISSNNEIVDDGPAGIVYMTDGTDSYPVLRPLFEPIYLWPGRINQLRFIIGSGAFSFEAGNTWGIRAEYHPRRLSF